MGFRKRRRRRLLGATVREGERTGVPHIDPQAIWGPSKFIVDSFKPCEGDGVKPALLLANTVVKDLDNGASLPVKIWVEPDDRAFGRVHGSLRPVVTVDGERRPVITIKPKAGTCLAPWEWKNEIESVLTHELTHAVDPSVWKSKRKPPKGSGCAYFSDPREVTAFLAQMRHELRTLGPMTKIGKLRRAGWISRPEEILDHTIDWRTIKGCLSSAQKKRFYRLAADTWKHIFSDDLYGARQPACCPVPKRRR